METLNQFLLLLIVGQIRCDRSSAHEAQASNSIAMENLLTSFSDCEQNLIIEDEFILQLRPSSISDQPIRLFDSVRAYKETINAREASNPWQAFNPKQNCVL